jgi:hypothetical protein
VNLPLADSKQRGDLLRAGLGLTGRPHFRMVGVEVGAETRFRWCFYASFRFRDVEMLLNGVADGLKSHAE